jgi:PQQ-dependent catabolism-associated CXXCW motif protein
VIAGCAALLLAAAEVPPEPETYRMDDYRAPVPETVSGGRVVHTAELAALVKAGRVILIDVLPAPRRPAGMPPDAVWAPRPRLDIPSSIWLPDVGRGALPPAVETRFRDALSAATGGDIDRQIVFYCLDQCWMSWNATKRAAKLGYKNVAWYPEGTDGWSAAGLPLVVAIPTAMEP